MAVAIRAPSASISSLEVIINGAQGSVMLQCEVKVEIHSVEWYMKMLFDYAGVLAGFEINGNTECKLRDCIKLRIANETM